MCIERYKTSISHSTIKDYSVPVTIEYLSDGIKVGIIDIYLDTDVLFDEDVFKGGAIFDSFGVENGEIGVTANFDAAFFVECQSFRGNDGHLL